MTETATKEKLRKQKNMRSIKMHIFCYAMMFPAIASFIVFYVYVNFSSILMAFQVPVGAGGEFEWGFGNFSYFFREMSISHIIYFNFSTFY